MFADDGAGAAVISEVMWMGSDLSTSDEWVEIACPTSHDCNLSGWTFTSLKSTGEEAVIISFATGAVIATGEVRVLSNFSLSSSRLAAEPWMTTPSMSLPNSKLLLRLRDATGTVQDEVDDGIGNPFAGANPSGGPKASMERIDLSASGNVEENWRTAVTAFGFKDGVPIFGTPGVISSPPMPFHGGGESSSEGSSSISLPPLGEGSGMGASSISSSLSSGSGSSMSSESTSSTSSASSVSSPDNARDDTAGSSASSASSVSFPSIFITEVLANPIGADTDEWIEIANLGADETDIAGWSLGAGSRLYHILPRSGSGFLLAAGEHVSFRKSVTGLSLSNSGERVSLMNGSSLIDAFEYPLTAEEVSFGREPDAPFALHAFCVPTEGGRNAGVPLPSRIVIQDAGSAAVGSAYVQGTEHVTLNLEAAVGAGSLASAACAWDFGDDAVSGACNPPSHTFSDAGDFDVRLTVHDFCGGISVAQLRVTVLQEPEDVIASSSSSLRSSSSSSRSSVSSLSSIASFSSPSPVRIATGVVLSEVKTTGDEWIELFNPTDREISLGGWMLDDLKNGGSKPNVMPPDTVMGPRAYRTFSKSETKLSLNDSGDDVWLIAPDASWSDHVSIPKLKAGMSFSFCDGEWRSSDSTPELPNACETVTQSSASSVRSSKKSVVAILPAFSRTRYVVASQSSISSLSLSSFQSGSFVMSYALSELPASLTVAGPVAEKSSMPEVSALGAFSGLGIALIWFGRKWWGL